MGPQFAASWEKKAAAVSAISSGVMSRTWVAIGHAHQLAQPVESLMKPSQIEGGPGGRL